MSLVPKNNINFKLKNFGADKVFVISEKSSSSENIKGLNIAEVAEQLGVRYIVDGTFKGSNEELEVEISPDVKVRVVRSTIKGLVAKK